MSRLEIFLLGSPHIELDKQGVITGERKAIALLAYLVVTGRAHSRDRLATFLWPEQANARTYLRHALWALKKAGLGAWLKVSREEISFRPGYWLDVAALEAGTSASRQHEHAADAICPDCLTLLAGATSLYRDDFLAGFTLRDAPAFDEWQYFEVERLKQLQADGLMRLALYEAQHGNYQLAIEYACRWVTIDPLHEPAHQTLMVLYARSGQQAAAMRQYRLCVRTLHEALNVEPSLELVAMAEQIRLGELDRAYKRELLSPHLAPSPPHNLPPQPTPFVGRERELQELAALITNSDARLITILGPGGIGKTRLAVEAAKRQLPEQANNSEGTTHFPQGIFFVSLQPVAVPEQIIPTLARTLNFPLESGDQERRPARQQLLDYLREKRLLLIMDNFEHLLDGGNILADLLNGAPGVKILATSRERLGLAQEQLYLIEGLTFSNQEGTNIAGRYTAIRLFLQCAHRIRSDFVLRPGDLPALHHLCRLVEGMPLAIELAATWVGVLSLSDIADEIQCSIDFLQTNARILPERHRSMRAVMDTAWQRLSQAEQMLFAQLSVFQGGFNRTAAQETTSPATTLQLLAVLTEKSLLSYDRATDRFHMHELLRQYSAEKLAGNPEMEWTVRSRHATYYTARLGRLEADLKAARQREALAAIEVDRGNMHAAWRWTVTHLQIERLADAIESMGLFYQLRGLYEEGWAAFRDAAQAVSGIRATTPTVIDGSTERHELVTKVLARLLSWQAVLSYPLTEIASAGQLVEQSLALLRSLPEEETIQESAFAFLVQGTLGALEGTYEAAGHSYQRSAALYQQASDDWGSAAALIGSGNIHWHLGNYHEAQRFVERGWALYQALGNYRGMADTQIYLARITGIQGKLEEAERFLRESLPLYEELGDRLAVSRTRHFLGTSFYLSGRFVEAYAALNDELTMAQELGMHEEVVNGMSMLASVSLDLGEYEEAAHRSQRSLNLASRLGYQRVIQREYWTQGCAALAQGAADEAQTFFERSVAYCRASGHAHDLADALAGLALSMHRLGKSAQARRYFIQALQLSSRTHSFFALLPALPGVAVFLADTGYRERGVEIYALASSHPYVANSRWFQDIAGTHIAAVVATLPAGVAKTAEARGRELDFWSTAASLVDELRKQVRHDPIAGKSVAGKPLS